MSVASRKRFTTSATTRAQHENDDRSPYMGRGNHHDNSPRGHFDRDDRTPANTPRKTKSGQELIVIGPSRPRTAPETIETTPSPLHEGDLSNLSNALLTYETEAVLDNTRMEISLLKPQSFSKKVSKERFEQLSQQLYQSFNQLQLWSYYQNALQEGKPGAVPTPSKYAPKADLIKAILRGRWGVKIAEEIQAHDDFIEVQKLRSTRQNVFFLVGEGIFSPFPRIPLYLAPGCEHLALAHIMDESRDSN